jgi:hypothetical protein
MRLDFEKRSVLNQYMRPSCLLRVSCSLGIVGRGGRTLSAGSLVLIYASRRARVCAGTRCLGSSHWVLVLALPVPMSYSTPCLLAVSPAGSADAAMA